MHQAQINSLEAALDRKDQAISDLTMAIQTLIKSNPEVFEDAKVTSK